MRAACGNLLQGICPGTGPKCVLLLLPADLKNSVLESNEEGHRMRSVELLAGVLETLQRGGAAVCSLKPVNTAKEGLSVLRRWRLARARVAAVSLPQVDPFEELAALGSLSQNLERRHERLRTLLGLLRTSPQVFRPSKEGVEKMIALLEQQFQLLTADEHVKASKNSDPDPQAAKGKGKGKAKEARTTEKKPCPFIQKCRSCKCGDKCYYQHAPANPKAASKRATSEGRPSGRSGGVQGMEGGKLSLG